jgi:hypothetical protein
MCLKGRYDYRPADAISTSISLDCKTIFVFPWDRGGAGGLTH